MLSFCIPPGAIILLIVTIWPSVALQGILGIFGISGIFINDNNYWQRMLFGVVVEMLLVWGFFRILEKSHKTPTKPFRKRFSTRAALVFILIIIGIFILTFIDNKLGLSC